MPRKKNRYDNPPYPNLLEEYRKKQGKTVVEAASFLRRGVASIFRYENGIASPEAPIVPLMEEFYGADFYKLYKPFFDQKALKENTALNLPEGDPNAQ